MKNKTLIGTTLLWSVLQFSQTASAVFVFGVDVPTLGQFSMGQFVIGTTRTETFVFKSYGVDSSREYIFPPLDSGSTTISKFVDCTGFGFSASYQCFNVEVTPVASIVGDYVAVEGIGWHCYFEDFGEVCNDFTAASIKLTYEAVISQVTPVPIPAAGWLMASGIAGIGAAKIRRKKKSRAK